MAVSELPDSTENRPLAAPNPGVVYDIPAGTKLGLAEGIKTAYRPADPRGLMAKRIPARFTLQAVSSADAVAQDGQAKVILVFSWPQLAGGPESAHREEDGRADINQTDEHHPCRTPIGWFIPALRSRLQRIVDARCRLLLALRSQR